MNPRFPFFLALAGALYATISAQAQERPVRNRLPSSPPVSGPPLPAPSGGTQGTFGTNWARPYPQTGSQIRTDAYRDREPYEVQTRPSCPAGTRRSQGGSCVR